MSSEVAAIPSFAEYDTLLTNREVFVQTPALAAASDSTNPHCFFVGRRGTGKTTITRYLMETQDNVVLIRPELFSPSSSILEPSRFLGGNQRPFKSLIAAFRRGLQGEFLLHWSAQNRGRNYDLPQLLQDELSIAKADDFDLRTLSFIEEITEPLDRDDDQAWLLRIKHAKSMSKAMDEAKICVPRSQTLLLDAIDESWDGSELAVLYLAALMHACVEINSHGAGMRVLVFLRENIFERVRVRDTEFARLETCVVGLDWTEEQLLEMVERRLNAPLQAKLPLRGATWSLFFEDPERSRDAVFEYCQRRPRDVLTYTGLALDNAQSHKHAQIMIEDLQDARRRFSDSRLGDLGDEYQENYPQIAIVLGRFYALGRRWTLPGIGAVLDRLLMDDQIKESCGEWIYDVSTPELFVRLLYNIGFVGLSVQRGGKQVFHYRSLGPRDTTPPAVTDTTDIQVHPSYWDSLELQDVLLSEFDQSTQFARLGLVNELPDAIKFDEYVERLGELQDALKTLPAGREHASAYEDIVGDVIRLCFFRALANVEDQVRDVDGTKRRDWVASNGGHGGFWEMLLQRYGATQVVFECKNYEDLKASDFQQANYYLESGGVVVICFRGELSKHYFQHIQKIAASGKKMVLLLGDKDLLTFMRQARNGRTKEEHIRERYDTIKRAIT